MKPTASLNFYAGTMPPNRAFLLLAAPSLSLILSRKFAAHAREMKQLDAPDPDPGIEFCRIMVGQECIWQGSIADTLSAVRARGMALCDARQALFDQRLVRTLETAEILEVVGLAVRLQYRDRKWMEKQRAAVVAMDALIRSAVRKVPT